MIPPPAEESLVCIAMVTVTRLNRGDCAKMYWSHSDHRETFAGKNNWQVYFLLEKLLTIDKIKFGCCEVDLERMLASR